MSGKGGMREMTMIEEAVERMKRLQPEDQQQVLELIEQLEKQQPSQQGVPLKGKYAHLGAHLREEDLEEVRREMWKNFPRDLEP